MTKFNTGKVSVLSVVAAFVVSLCLLVNSVAPVLATSHNSDNIRICHASNSQTNPYENPTVDPDSILKTHGHDSHEGPIWYSGISDHSWGDIIPQFDYDYIQGQNHYVGHYAGKNWTTGQAIWNNNCNVPTATPTPTPAALSCSINVNPAFASGNEFSFGQVYNFSATTTGNVLNYAWSITPSAPALSSTNLSTTSWTAPLVPAQGVVWTLTLNVSDNSDNSNSCSVDFKDPANTVPSPTPTDNNSNNGGGDGLGCATHDCSGNKTNNSATQGQVLGASTMASTGSFEETFYQAIMSVGATLSAFGLKGLKKGRKVSKKK